MADAKLCAKNLQVALKIIEIEEIFQTNLAIGIIELSLLFWHFINATAYHLDLCVPLNPSICSIDKVCVVFVSANVS